MAEHDPDDDAAGAASNEELAARAFVRRQAGDWSALDQADLESWLADPASAEAYRKVRKQWSAAVAHADSPEILKLREEVMARARSTRAPQRPRALSNIRGSWAAAIAGALILGAVATAFLDDVSETFYETGIGEQRVVELEDHSRIALDAKTSVMVRMTRDSRVLQLVEGQAQFMVASDPRRPFRVEAGQHTITAVGTSFNVEFVDDSMSVAMVEGKVAISVGKPAVAAEGAVPQFAAGNGTTDLVAGQELHVAADGEVQFIPEADVVAAVMWRQGKIIFKDASLSEAVRRINRYSRMQIEIEGREIEALRISGIFDAGDTKAFIEAIQAYLPLVAVQDGPQLMRLRPI